MFSRRSATTLLPLLVLAAAVAGPASASWLMDGTRVVGAAADQLSPLAVPGPDHGAILVFYDRQSGVNRVCAQAFDGQGVPLRSTQVSLSPWGASASDLAIAEGDDGAALCAWVDDRSGTRTAYVQRLDAAGLPMWTYGGIVVSGDGDEHWYCQVAADGDGGAIVFWQASTAVARILRGQRIDASGTLLWGPDGVVISDDMSTGGLAATADAEGGAYVAWAEQLGTSPRIWVQRLSPSGSGMWPAGGVAVTATEYYQVGPVIAGDDKGGPIVAWTDRRNGHDEICAQRLDDKGGRAWAADGVMAGAVELASSEFQLRHDGQGGAFIGWLDHSTGFFEPFAQCIDDLGAVRWGSGGLSVSSGVGSASAPRLVTVAKGVALLAWVSGEDSRFWLRAQKLAYDGTPAWDLGGVKVAGWMEQIVLLKGTTSDGDGGALLTFHDDRDGDDDIFAVRVHADGSLGWEPALQQVSDLPGDEGGWVGLSVAASTHDAIGVDYYPTVGYNVWRLDDGAKSPSQKTAPVAIDPVRLVCNPLAALETPDPGDRIAAAADDLYGFPPGDWISVGYHAARQLEQYLLAAPTRSDSTSAGTPAEQYVVTVHTSVPWFYWVIGPQAGYSVDNLAPGAPTGLSGRAQYDPQGLLLSWDPNPEDDLAFYLVHRGDTPEFIPSRSTEIGRPTGPALLDDVTGWDTSWYKISAVDRHGNDSPLATLGPDGMSAIGGGDPPPATVLTGAHPNPFNPRTTISYHLAAPGPVRLEIYDPAGRLVRTLVDALLPAGGHRTVWDGRDDAGRNATSGVYLVRLRTDGYAGAGKLILVR